MTGFACTAVEIPVMLALTVMGSSPMAPTGATGAPRAGALPFAKGFPRATVQAMASWSLPGQKGVSKMGKSTVNGRCSWEKVGKHGKIIYKMEDCPGKNVIM